MDKLQHIDELLKSSASSFANGLEVGDKDWLAVERKLKQRKNRIYAVWFFLAFIVASSTFILINNITSENSIVTQPVIQDNSVNQPENISDLGVEDQIKRDIRKSQENIQSDKLSTIKNNNTVEAQHNSERISSNSPLTQTQNIEDGPTVINEGIAPKRLEVLLLPSKSTCIAKYDLDNTKSILDYPLSIPTIVLKDVNSLKKKNSSTLNGYWEAGVSFTPSISGKFISENTQLAGLINRGYYSKVANSENASFSNSAGLNAQYHSPSGFFAASGLFIAQRTEAINYNYTITEFPRVNNNEITGYNPLSTAAYINIEHNGSNSYHFVEIPLNIGYKQSISSNFELRGQLGMSYLNLFNLNGLKADYTSLELKNLNSYGFNQHNLALNAKVGLYLNKKNFVVGIEPIFNYNITSLSDKNTAINIKPYSYGFNISTNYKFKN